MNPAPGNPQENPNLDEEKKKIEEMMKASDEIIDQVVHMAPFELCKKLSYVGVQETYKEAFEKLIPDGQFTPQPIVEHWVKAIPKESGPLERIFLEAAAAKLWSIWVTDKPMDRALHFFYQQGYQDQTDGELERCFKNWTHLWQELQKRGYKTAADVPESLTLGEPPDVHLQLKDWAEDFKHLAADLDKPFPITSL